MFSLFILSHKEMIEDRHGDPYRVQRVYYKYGEEMHTLQGTSPLPPLDDVEIWRELWKGTFLRIRVWKELRQAILNFMLFKHMKADDDFNCHAFACEYADVPRHEIPQIFDHWKLERRRVKRGEVVFLFSPQVENGEVCMFFHHAAIKIGFDLYLSVWSAGGQLEVATMGDMVKYYKATQVYVATPRAA